MTKLYVLVLGMLVGHFVHGQESEASVSPLSISGSIAVNASTDDVIKRMNRAWKYSFGQEPAAKILIKGPNELKASAQFYFKSETVTARNDTRGVISYQVTLKAVAGKCLYEIHQFVHRGNTTVRSGGIHFGRLMEGADPGGQVRGLGRKNTQRIHEEMKSQVSARLDKVLLIFKQQLMLGDE
jgi:hypothetical protein